ncbi:MAG: transposase, partial [Akkermansia sp.]|nr:transposase [Akkermansia sp.]
MHIVFRIKHDSCFMKEEHLSRIFQYIAGSIRAMAGYANMVGGRPDHIHIITSCPPTISLAEFVRNIKAGSSKWIKSLAPDYKDFAWQEGYGA